MGLVHFILTQILWTNVKSVTCSSAWMPVYSMTAETSYEIKES